MAKTHRPKVSTIYRENYRANVQFCPTEDGLARVRDAMARVRHVNEDPDPNLDVRILAEGVEERFDKSQPPGAQTSEHRYIELRIYLTGKP